jgi:predicted nucleic acid-binding protein
MNIVDSSGWLEYFSGGPNSEQFSSPLQDPSSLIVPLITIYEVFKVVLRESGENEALQSVAAMQKGAIIDLTTSIAMNASKLRNGDGITFPSRRIDLDQICSIANHKS